MHVPLTLSFGCTDGKSRSGLGWDQYSVNQRLFSVQSTYREEIYTTALVKDESFGERRVRAEQLAREIEAVRVSAVVCLHR